MGDPGSEIIESVPPAGPEATESTTDENEDDIQFVCEGPLRPVLEYIDLVSSDDEEPSTSHSDGNVKHKDHIDHQKDKVALTLARLARHVEVEKQQKEEKNRAFREKVDFQHAHGLQELEFIRGHSDTEAARLCVDQWLKMPDGKGIPYPISFPSFAKKLLISLCKDVPFQVKCVACHQALRSHMELTAHFRVRCRNAGPVAVAEKSIAQVAEKFILRGYCPNCNQVFLDETSTRNHKQNLGHKVRVINSMEESVLLYCYTSEGNKPPSDLNLLLDQSKFSSLKRTMSLEESSSQDCNTIPKKKMNLGDKSHEGTFCVHKEKSVAKTWFCECHQRFPSEDLVEKHVFSANTMCYKCVVCGKVCEDSGVIRLHMSRIHGGAHLNNFLFWCRTCKKELTRKESIMTHVTEFHSGHRYFYEMDEVESATVPSSSTALGNNLTAKNPPSSITVIGHSPVNSPPRGKWQCRICEDMFDSQECVKQHCMSLASHQFHRYSCAHCKKTFHKVETLYRHCQDEHNNEIKIKYFCGLCDLTFNVEEAFLSHYKEQHSIDYVFVSEKTEPSIKTENDFPVLETSNLLTCGCRESYVCKVNRKEDYSRCLQIMLDKGKLWFRCSLCSATAQKVADMNTHIHQAHGEEKSEEEQQQYVIKCGTCTKTFHDPESAQQHFHTKHCFLQKPSVAPFGCEKTSLYKFVAIGSPRTERKLKQAVSYPKNSDVEKGADSDLSCQNIDEVVELPDLDYLRTMTHIVFVDFDNWSNFFGHLPGHLNQGTFIWGFQGGNTNWKPPLNCKVYNYLNRIGCFFLHPRCSKRKDAADFAICMHAGRLDEQLPKQIPFTILSGDQGFLELENQFKKTQRPAHILNPHHLEGDMMCALLNSISDTTKGINYSGSELCTIVPPRLRVLHSKTASGCLKLQINVTVMTTRA
ncbi:E3 SUMO-protein ligase ZNF451 isoform X5 [Artibeus jamaicensis]|uniref:E3 SUMO-protein ligase ZNF451 isoform X5 n=1 Tax=Artibeus jamaicensis TaxID=9417 RepID=UPI00235A9BA2|nr:E3 SUMO-protein ligase ZNF451 isoform X5 [Artibeus jamaicensis]